MPATKILTSEFFRDNEHLQNTAIDHRFHVQQGDQGPHVLAIQNFLFISRVIEDVPGVVEELGAGEVDLESLKEAFKAEASASFYGPVTALLVLSYKTIFDIVGRGYQTRADAIVGVMTIRHMDNLAQSPDFGADIEQREEAAASAPISSKPALMASPQVAARMMARLS